MSRSEPSAVEFLTTYGWALLAIIIVVGGALGFTVGSGGPASGENATSTPQVERDYLPEGLERIVFPGDGVVCYQSGTHNSISCLPLNETDVEVRP